MSTSRHKKATVEYDSTLATHDQLVGAIKKAGYRASPIAEDMGIGESHHHESIKSWRKKFLWGTSLSFPLLYFMLIEFSWLAYTPYVRPYAPICHVHAHLASEESVSLLML